MRSLTVMAVIVLLVCASDAGAQRRRTPAKKPAPPPPPKVEPAQLKCPEPLGTGVKTGASYCFVLAGREPAQGVVVTVPPHVGVATLMFDLHNRHTYSEEQVKANRASARYTAVIGALTLDNTLISRAAVQSEFRKVSDLVERIGGGAGPGGVKAVAPTGTEHVTITIPEAENQVSLLGEKLIVDRAEGTATYASPGRPIAVISNVMIEYQPPLPGRAGGRGK